MTLDNRIEDSIQERLIFLISQPRSGSTLLQKMLESSRDIASTGEPQFMAPLLSMYDNRLIDARYWLFQNIIALRAFFQETGFDETLIVDAKRAYADTLYGAILNKLQTRYFLDKSPPYVYIYPKLVEMYPYAKYIILTRNPAAVLSSYANTFEITDYNIMNRYEAVMQYEYSHNHMTQGFEYLCQALEHSNSNKFIVRYEELVEDPEAVINKICHYLGVTFESAMINYGEHADAKQRKYTMGDPSVVYAESRPQQHRADKWNKRFISQQDRKKFKEALAQVPPHCFQRLGYSREDTFNAIFR